MLDRAGVSDSSGIPKEEVTIHELDARHFVMEEKPVTIAEKIHALGSKQI